MKNNKGFSLIEIMAVIIIIGVMLTIAVPAVSSSIKDSRLHSYYATINSFLDTVRGEYESKKYGPYLADDEIMMVPLAAVELDEGNEEESPFGKYELDRSYFIITRNNNGFNIYTYVIDSNNYGIFNVRSDQLSKDDVIQNKLNEYANVRDYFECTTDGFVTLPGNFMFMGKSYIGEEAISTKRKDNMCEVKEYPVIVFELED